MIDRKSEFPYADVAHLLDLLDLLPPQANPDWESFWERVHGHDMGFYRDQLHQTTERLRNTPDDDLAKIWPELDATVVWKPAYTGAAGRRWQKDACETSWRIEVASMAALTPETRAKWFSEAGRGR